jgi:hypothetical protein
VSIGMVLYVVAAILFALAAFIPDSRLLPAGLAFFAGGHLL